MIGTYLKVYEADGSFVSTDAADEPRINAAVSRYIESNGTRDTILDLSLLDGSTYWVLASRIGAWYVTTPEQRQHSIEWENDHRAETTETKRRLGIWEDE